MSKSVSKHCTITFDQNEHGTYFTGQVITGKVILNFNKPKKLRGIKLQICGYAAAQWRDRRGRPLPVQDAVRRRKHRFFGREDYIASTNYLLGSEQSQSIPIETGTYTYTFGCPIPTNCPSSFEGTYGHIRYMAKVVFIRSGASNRTHNVGFTVLKLLDLNQESKLLKEPACTEAIENFCFMRKMPVELKVTLTQTGYVPGQYMLVTANLRNNSNADCKKLVVMLYLRATYTADVPSFRTTSEKILLLKKECGSTPCGLEKSYCETLRIPATAPTCEHLCKVVRVSYEVRVEAVMNWYMANPRAMIPITIGNVPLATVAGSSGSGGGCGGSGGSGGEGYAPLPRDLPTTSARAMQLAAAGLSNEDYMDENLEDYALPEDGDDEFETEEEIVHEPPPPTYEEAMFMTANIADTDANTVSEAAHFTPRYPVFDVDNFQSPPPNPPQKRRRRRRRRPNVENPKEVDKEKLITEQNKRHQEQPQTMGVSNQAYEESPIEI